MLVVMANQWDVNSGAAPSSKSVSAESGVSTVSRDELLLARTRAVMQLQIACSPAQRSSLEDKIANIDAQLAER